MRMTKTVTAMWRTGAILLCLFAAGHAAAQVYKWKDASGVTHFSDTPPPPTAKQAEVKSFAGSGAASTTGLPYELAQAVKTFPVVLYTTRDCSACDQGRSWLRGRGIPYAEKTVNSPDDQAALKRAGGSNQLPMLTIGRNQLTGFEAGAWDAALASASYPAERQLPAGYQFPPPSPAAPLRQANAPAAGTDGGAQPAQSTQRPPPVNAPPDFQF